MAKEYPENIGTITGVHIAYLFMLIKPTNLNLAFG
jgi:hypothetical protein